MLYDEDVYVGSRYYDEVEISPLFRFGHGLSYTTSALSELSLGMQSDRHSAIVQCKLSNTGTMAGAELVQVYVAPVGPPVKRPVKELKAFKKVSLAAGDAASVDVELDAIRATSF